MILSIKDRLFLPAIFANNKDSMTEAAVQRSIRQLIAISTDEAKAINLHTTELGCQWDAVKGIDKLFDIDASQLAYLKESIYTLSKSGGVTQELLPICEKINAV